MIALIERVKPKIVINVALPYQDLHIMDACLATGVDYLDTANYEPLDEAKFEYKWQWAYHERFKQAGIMALLGSGFDPGVTNVYTAHLHKHEFDEIEYRNVGLAVLNLRAPSVLLGFQVGGIVGHRFLSEYRVSMDVGRSELRLEKF